MSQNSENKIRLQEPLPAPLQKKWESLLENIRAMGSALVAFSGGVDSSVLAAATRLALGEKMLAVTAHSPAQPAPEQRMATLLAKTFDIPHLVLETNEDSLPKYRANPPEKCYYCKQYIFERLLKEAARRNLSRVLEGSNLDDEGGFRPGRRAIDELNIAMPLLTAELNKVELRQLAKALGLPNWNQPNSACLSSRIPTGYPIDAAALARIQEAENQVRALGFRQVRVRHLEHGRVARVEVDPEEVERLEELWEKLAKRLLSLGYEHISYNPDGYQKPGTVKEEE